MATTPPGTSDVAAGGPLAPRPVTAHRILVPLDGSPFAERALPVARWLAESLDVPVHLVQVVAPGEDTGPASSYMDTTARRHDAASGDVVPDDDVAGAIVRALDGDLPAIACLATHGRNRSSAVLGSVAADIVERVDDSVLLVGPQAATPRGRRRLVAAVEGTPEDDEEIVETALGWAQATGWDLLILTVAEPTPPPYREDRPTRRARGPSDPEAYVDALVKRSSGSGVDVQGRVTYDPVSVRDGVVDTIGQDASLVVLGTHLRSRPARTLRGSHAARIIHDLPVPALLVPLSPRG